MCYSYEPWEDNIQLEFFDGRQISCNQNVQSFLHSFFNPILNDKLPVILLSLFLRVLTKSIDGNEKVP